MILVLQCNAYMLLSQLVNDDGASWVEIRYTTGGRRQDPVFHDPSPAVGDSSLRYLAKLTFV
jgi:hypothetical protein